MKMQRSFARKAETATW